MHTGRNQELLCYEQYPDEDRGKIDAPHWFFFSVMLVLCSGYV